MSDPNEIRAEIDRTRAEVGHDVDALAEKVSPLRAVGRQTDRIRERVDHVRESVMGSSEGPGVRDRTADLAHQAGDAVGRAPGSVKRRTRGNPFAAGLVAFGAGWLVGSLIPASRAEQDAAQAVKEHSEPMVEEAKSIAQEAGGHLKPQAEQAAKAVQSRASEGAQEVKAQGQGHASHLQDETKRAGHRVKDERF